MYDRQWRPGQTLLPSRNQIAIRASHDIDPATVNGPSARRVKTKGIRVKGFRPVLSGRGATCPQAVEMTADEGMGSTAVQRQPRIRNPRHLMLAPSSNLRRTRSQDENSHSSPAGHQNPGRSTLDRKPNLSAKDRAARPRRPHPSRTKTRPLSLTTCYTRSQRRTTPCHLLPRERTLRL
jgi:hypothetical protein